MKKIFAISFVLVLAFSQAGYYFISHESQQEWKENMRQQILPQLKAKDLTVIPLSGNEEKIDWEEEGKEFSFNGEMYDVIKTSVADGKIILYCINDTNEQQLMDHYNSITKHNSSDEKKRDNIDNSITLFFEPAGDINRTDEIKFNQQLLLPHFYFPSALIKDISPPPKA